MSMITVQQHQGQLVVDSRLVALELDIQHESLFKTIYNYQTEIEQEFGILRFEIGEIVGRGQPVKYCFLTEDQSLYLMTLSKNTDQVRLAKRNLVKAFRNAKDDLEQKPPTPSSKMAKKSDENTPDILAVLAHMSNTLSQQNQKITDIGFVVNEYVNIRKFADTELPGYAEITKAIIDCDMKLPQISSTFTAPEWVNNNASHLSQRQRICFYKEIAGLHRSLIDNQPRKINGTYWYNTKHEMLFARTLKVVELMIPEESIKRPQPQVSEYNQISALTDDEQALVGTTMRLKTLSICLGQQLSPSDFSRLNSLIKPSIKSGLIKAHTTEYGATLFEVCPVLITKVKQFAEVVI